MNSAAAEYGMTGYIALRLFTIMKSTWCLKEKIYSTKLSQGVYLKNDWICRKVLWKQKLMRRKDLIVNVFFKSVLKLIKKIFILTVYFFYFN